MRYGLLLSLACVLLPCSAHAQLSPVPITKLPPELRAQVDTLVGARTSANDAKVQKDAITVRADIDKEKAKIAASMIGLGWDIWKGEMAAKCAEAKTVLRIPIGPSGKNPHNIDKYGQIDTVHQYHDNRSSGINFDLTYELVSFSLGTSTGSQASFKSTSKFIDIFKRSVGDEYKGSEWKPTSTATGLVGNATQFAKTCGQRFITRVGFGVQLDAQLAANIEVNETAQTNKVEVGIGFGDLIGFGANSADTVTELRKHAQLSVHLAGASGEGPKPEDLIEYARTFGNVGDVDGSFQTVFVETRSYAEFPSFKKFVDVSTKATGTLLLFTADRLQALQQFEDLKTATAKPTFVKVTDLAGTPITDLDAASKTQAMFLDKLSLVYTACSVAITDALITDCQKVAGAIGSPPVKLRFELINQKP